MKFDNDKIRQLREQEGLSQRQFAKMLNVSRQRIIQYEQKKCSPGQKFLCKVCEVFGVDPNYFFVSK